MQEMRPKHQISGPSHHLEHSQADQHDEMKFRSCAWLEPQMRRMGWEDLPSHFPLSMWPSFLLPN